MPKVNPREIPQSLRGFGERLREERKAAGVTLTDLAEDIGTSASVLSRAETDPKRPPSLFEAARIAEALGLRLGYLLTGEPPRAGRVVTVLVQDVREPATDVRGQVSSERSNSVPAPRAARGKLGNGRH